MPLSDARYPRIQEVRNRIIGMVRGRLNAAIRYLVHNPELADDICHSLRISSEDDSDRETELIHSRFGCLDAPNANDSEHDQDLKQCVTKGLKKSAKLFEQLTGLKLPLGDKSKRREKDADWGVRYGLALIASHFASMTREEINQLSRRLDGMREGRLAQAIEWCRQRIPAPYNPEMIPTNPRSSPDQDLKRIGHELGFEVRVRDSLAIVCGALMLIGRELVGREPIKSKTTYDRHSAATANDRGELSGSVTLLLIIRASKLDGLQNNKQDISCSQLENWLSECSYYWVGHKELGTTQRWADIESRLALDDSVELSNDLGEQEVYMRFEFDLSQPLPRVSIPLLQDALRSGIRPIRLVRMARINILASADALRLFTIT